MPISIDLAQISLQSWLSFGAAGVSVVSALYAARQRRRELRVGFTQEIIDWAKDAMSAMAVAQVYIFEARGRPPQDAMRLELRASLSKVVEHGRLFFTNKEGLRPHILDPLMRMYRLLESDFSDLDDAQLQKVCDRHRRDFCAEVQKVVDPSFIRKVVDLPDSPAGVGANDFRELEAPPAHPKVRRRRARREDQT